MMIIKDGWNDNCDGDDCNFEDKKYTSFMYFEYYFLTILGIITSWKDKDLGQGFDTLPIGAMHKRKYFCPIDVFPYKN